MATTALIDFQELGSVIVKHDAPVVLQQLKEIIAENSDPKLWVELCAMLEPCEMTVSENQYENFVDTADFVFRVQPDGSVMVL